MHRGVATAWFLLCSGGIFCDMTAMLLCALGEKCRVLVLKLLPQIGIEETDPSFDF